MIAHINFDIEFFNEEQKKSLRTCLEEVANHFVGKVDTPELREATEKAIQQVGEMWLVQNPPKLKIKRGTNERY